MWMVVWVWVVICVGVGGYVCGCGGYKRELRSGKKWDVLLGRIGQKRIYTPYMTVCLVISLPKVPYTHCISVY